MIQNKVLISIIALLGIIVVVMAWQFSLGEKIVSIFFPKEINSFEDCAAAGYPVMESYPRQCKTPDGRTFVENISKTTATPSPLATNLPEIISGVKSLLYENKEFGFQLQYPEGSDVKKEGSEGFLRVTQNGAVAARIFLSDSLFKGTNLNEAAVVVGVSSDNDAISKCNKAVDTQEQDLGTTNINGVSFHAFAATGAAAGNLYESKIYRTIHNGSCYEIVDMLHSGNIGNYPAGSVKEFDKPKFSGILESITRTFIFTSDAGSGVMGAVSLGPTCPVVKNPPDPACADKPYKTTVQAIKVGSPQSSPFKTVQSDEQGRYIIFLPPGEYGLQPTGGNSLPRCGTKTVIVEPNVIKSADLSCDTGIR